MKLIFKINEYFPDTRQISFTMCKSTSKKSIDDHTPSLIGLDELDYWDGESFVHAIVNRIGEIKVREENKSETSLPQNASEVIAGDINIQDLIGKVIEGEISESYGLQKTLIKMNKIDL